MLTTIKAVIFDFAGVILDCSPIFFSSFVSNLFEIPNLNVEEGPLASLGDDLIQGKITDQFFWESYANHLKRPLPLRWRERLKKFLIQCKINDKVWNFAQSLKNKGIIIPLVSNVAPYQAQVFKDLGYYKIFSPLFLSCEVGLKKPDSRMFEFMLNTIHCSPQECIFIDDDIRNIQVATTLGLHTIHFITPKQLGEINLFFSQEMRL